MSKHNNAERKEDKSQYVPQRNKFKEELKIRELKWTENQQKIVDCILDKDSKIIFIAGPAGSGKSLLTTYCGLHLLEDKKVSDYLFLRNPLECSDSASMGYIKGDQNSKFEPYCQIMEEKLSELLHKSDIERLKNDNRIHYIPTNYIRGLSMNVKFCHVEEAANYTMNEFWLMLTRYGQHSKFVFSGDFLQTDLTNGKRGAFRKIFDLFNNEESKEKGIFSFELEKKDIKRSDITAFIIDKLEKERNP